ncbi:caspase family protein [Prosthecomicrobium sp. N25]|uniref:caspase family protein n=1 Tax=Prosthecomicrobium sp. N25 TaxID=3129254 RepID=UPI003077C3D7
MTFLVAINCFIVPVRGQTIHVFEIYDTHDRVAGPFIEVAAEQIEQFTSTAVPDALGKAYRTVRKVYSGSSFEIDGLRDYLRSVEMFGARDIVLLFYIGHGADDPHSRLPMLWLPDRASGQTQYAAQTIVDELRARRPRTLIAVFEACNVDDNIVPPSPGTVATFDPNQVRSILSNSFGIAIASAQEGQYSFVSSSGGIFSNKFLGLFRAGSSLTLSSFIAAAGSGIKIDLPRQPIQRPWVERLW